MLIKMDMRCFFLCPILPLAWRDTMNPWKGKEEEPTTASLVAVLSTAELLVHSALKGSVPKES